MTESLEQPKQNERRRTRRLSDLVIWLILTPFVFLTLLCFSELAMIIDLENLAADTRTLLQAAYQPWPYDEIPPIDIAALFSDIQKDLEVLGTPFTTPTVQEGNFWVPVTPTPDTNPVLTATEELPFIASATNTDVFDTPTRPISTSTMTRQATATSTITTAPTRTFAPTIAPTNTSAPPPENTKTPVPAATTTPVPPATPTSTQTTEPTATKIIVTSTSTAPATNTPVPATATPIATATTKIPPTVTVGSPTPETETPAPSPTPILVFPIAENGGESSPDPDGQGCMAIFGYRNESSNEVDIPAGDQNYLSITPVRIEPDDELPTHFRTDRVSPAFGVVWNVPGPISWFLSGQEAVVQWCNP